MMNRRIPYDEGLIVIVLALLGFGLIMVFSASTVVSAELYGSQTWIFTRQLLFVILGLVTLMVSMKIDYHFYERRSVIYSLLTLSLLLLVFLLVVPGSSGVQRWIRFGPANFQPSELAKLAVILFSSFYLATRKEELHSFKQGVLPYLAVVGTVVFLVLIEPDLGTAASIALTAGFLLFLGGVRYRYLLGLLLAVIPALYFLVVLVPYRLNRILAFLYPERDPYGIGYQIRQSLIAVGSGGWNGLGYAQGKQKLFFLPEPHTDFIYAVVGEEFGFLGCVTVLVLFGLLFWRGTRIAVRAESAFGTYLGLGIACMIVFQAFVNMSMVISLLPTKGLPLPFISMGGSSMIMTMAAVGILLNISRQGRGAVLRDIKLSDQ
ncbi:MAG: putative lipid II flippase FtsW [Acidobacteria bacterium]|nr:putative lipid II flippase FtsW [Acidobacteriota bacterium]MCZ6877686.1 putative lipid II flippase FtsW [Acidobacteriota bacterium]